MIMLSFAAYAIYVLALAAAGTSDLVHYEIPNALSGALLAGFALIAAALPAPVIFDHILAGLTILGLTSLLFATGLCGGGDVKLLAATALWMGWSHLGEFLLATALAGAALSILLLVARRLAGSRVLASTGVRPRRLFAKDAGVPYGVAIATGGLCMLPQIGPQIGPVALAAAGVN
jgi:prepilin peptidase CpaA